jgi:hypothetical protein
MTELIERLQNAAEEHDSGRQTVRFCGEVPIWRG